MRSSIEEELLSLFMNYCWVYPWWGLTLEGLTLETMVKVFDSLWTVRCHLIWNQPLSLLHTINLGYQLFVSI